MIDAFGIERPDLVSKADDRSSGSASAARLVGGGLLPGAHGAVAGRKGKKLKAVGHELGGAAVGTLVALPNVGAAVGTNIANKKGYYKPEPENVEKRDAFGVVRVDLAKAQDLVVSDRAGYHNGNLVGHGVGPAGPAQAPRRSGARRQATYRTGAGQEMPKRPSRAAEFKRGAKGGAMGSTARANTQFKVASTLNNVNAANLGQGKASDFKEARRASRVGREQMKGAFKSARENASRTSPHPHSVKAGTTAGRSAAFASRNPKLIGVGLATAGAGAGLAREVHRADKKVRERKRAEREVTSKALSTGAKVGLAAGAAGGYGALVGGSMEASRRISNKRGANIGAKENFRHPIRSSYKANAANYRHAAGKLEAGAARDEAKAAAKPGTRRAELRTVFAANQRESANVARHASIEYNTAAKHGALRAVREGHAKEYNPKKKYKAPTEIGKSDAFGVERPDLVGS